MTRPTIPGRLPAGAAPILCLLAAATLAACGTEIDAGEDAVTLAAALAPVQADAAQGSGTNTAAVMNAGTTASPPFADAIRRAGTGSGALVSALYSDHDVDVGARMDGAVRAVHAELGDAVVAGAILATLDDAVELAAVAVAEARFEMTRADHARVAALAGQGVMTPAELEQAVFRLRAAEAADADARARLERTRVRAPFAGLVSRRLVRLGQSVEEGQPLFRVTAMRPLRAQIRVPELAARHITRGDPVTLRALDGREVSGRVGRVAPTVDPASGTVEILVEVADPRGLPPGATVSARFVDPRAP